MILCLDAGNTRLKWGLLEADGWRRQGVLNYQELNVLLVELAAPTSRVLACNVAGETVRQHIEAVAARLRLPLTWLNSTAAACGVSNGYDSPQQLGADRWAALIAARVLHAGPVVVVMAGTATTIDALDGEGRFRGGLILPGLSLMHAALARSTADLPHASGHYQSLPTNTDDAIVSGAIHATLGAIERMGSMLHDDALCLLSGGAAIELAPHMTLKHRLIDNLVLEGLARFSLVHSL